jgi:hypothetical protein
MDKAFVVTGMMDGWRGKTPVGGIFFSNSAPDYATLAKLGFEDASIHHATPMSAQPTEPTLYYFDRASHTKMVNIICFDWQGAIINQVSVQGAPNKMVPPVSGEMAESVLYAPRAFLIKGCVDFPAKTPVLAVLIVKPVPGDDCLQPDVKTLKKMGLNKILSVEEVGLEKSSVHEDALYLVERSPSADGILLAKLNKKGQRESEKSISGDPMQLLPEITGPAVEQLFRNSLRPSDMPRPELRPQPKKKARR